VPAVMRVLSRADSADQSESKHRRKGDAKEGPDLTPIHRRGGTATLRHLGLKKKKPA